MMCRQDGRSFPILRTITVLWEFCCYLTPNSEICSSLQICAPNCSTVVFSRRYLRSWNAYGILQSDGSFLDSDFLSNSNASDELGQPNQFRFVLTTQSKSKTRSNTPPQIFIDFSTMPRSGTNSQVSQTEGNDCVDVVVRCPASGASPILRSPSLTSHRCLVSCSPFLFRQRSTLPTFRSLPSLSMAATYWIYRETTTPRPEEPTPTAEAPTTVSPLSPAMIGSLRIPMVSFRSSMPAHDVLTVIPFGFGFAALVLVLPFGFALLYQTPTRTARTTTATTTAVRTTTTAAAAPPTPPRLETLPASEPSKHVAHLARCGVVAIFMLPRSDEAKRKRNIHYRIARWILNDSTAAVKYST